MLSSELLQGFDKFLKGDFFILKKPPSGLRGGEGGGDFGGNGDSGGGFWVMFEVSFHEGPVAVVESLVRQICGD